MKDIYYRDGVFDDYHEPDVDGSPCDCPECNINPRDPGDDDGVEYADPRDERDERLNDD